MLITVKEYAEKIGKSEDTVRSAIKRGSLPSVVVHEWRRYIDSETKWEDTLLDKKTNHRHGLSSHPLYRVWCGMKQRCYNQHAKSYPNYGAKGIKVCDEWLNDPESFVRWGEKNGYKKGLSIDRIDSNDDYKPANCRFITVSENAKRIDRNQRNCFCDQEKNKYLFLLSNQRWFKAKKNKKVWHRYASLINEHLFIGFPSYAVNLLLFIMPDGMFCDDLIEIEKPSEEYIKAFIDKYDNRISYWGRISISKEAKELYKQFK